MIKFFSGFIRKRNYKPKRRKLGQSVKKETQQDTWQELDTLLEEAVYYNDKPLPKISI